MGIKISVITVVFNEKDQIEKNIKNVLEQTYENVEFIVVDGLSTDGTTQIIEKYSDRIDKIIVEKDKGIFDAMNKGWKAATGNYVYYLNIGDHFVSKDTLKEGAKLLSESNADFLYGNVLGSMGGEEPFRINKKMSRKSVRLGRKVVHQATFMKRALLHELGGFNLDYKLSADFDIYCRTYLADKTVVYHDIDIALFDLFGASDDGLNQVFAENRKIIHFNYGFFWALLYTVSTLPRRYLPQLFRAVFGDKAFLNVRRRMSR